VTEFVVFFTQVDNGTFRFPVIPGGVKIVAVNTVVQFHRRSPGQVKAGIGEFLKGRCRVHVAWLAFDRVADDVGNGFPRGIDNRSGIRIKGQCSQSDRYDQPVAGNFYPPEIACRHSLCFKVGLGETGGGEMAGATGVKGNVTIGADTSQEKADASLPPDPGFIFRTPVVNHEDGLLLEPLQLILRLPEAKRQVYFVFRKDLLVTSSAGQGYLIRIDHQRSGGIQSEFSDIVFVGIIPQTVVLSRADGVELPCLHKMKSAEIGFFNIRQTVFLQ